MNDTWYLPFFSGLWEESVRLVGALGFLHLFVLLPVSLVLVWRARRRPHRRHRHAGRDPGQSAERYRALSLSGSRKPRFPDFLPHSPSLGIFLL